MDNSADMIVLIDRGTMRFVDVNRTVCALLGYTREEMLAMGPQDVLPVTHAELEVAYDRLIAEPSLPSGMNSHYRCKDGSLLPFESTRQVLRSANGWLIAAISRDIRERLAAEKSLRDSEARFRSLTALSSDWYWEQDAGLRLTYMSNIQQTGLDSSAYLGRYRWDQPALNLTGEDWARHSATNRSTISRSSGPRPTAARCGWRSAASRCSTTPGASPAIAAWAATSRSASAPSAR
jgi:PAS domain S-box-containing protein